MIRHNNKNSPVIKANNRFNTLSFERESKFNNAMAKKEFNEKRDQLKYKRSLGLLRLIE
jgi:hypothetical protein